MTVSPSYTSWLTADLSDKSVEDARTYFAALEAYINSLSTVSTVREQISAARTIYVRDDGSDLNDGSANDAAHAYATVQKGIDVAASLDTSIYDVTVKLNPASRTTGFTLKSTTGAGKIIIEGDTATPSNCTFSVTSANVCVGTDVRGKWKLTGVKLATSTSGSCINLAGRTTVLEVGAVDFGACADTHMLVQEGATLIHSSNYAISGSAARHWNVSVQALVTIASSLTCTLSGTPAFSQQFARASLQSYLRAFGITFSGSATGQRYSVATQSLINTNGGGASFIPGNSAGSADSATYGLYA